MSVRSAPASTVYDDFFGYGPNSGVYTQVSKTVAGGHCIVIVGYDDSKQAWLVRNSWGTGWGMAGYCWFGYGQCNMDNYTKYGVPSTDTNPDPWTKRRAHNGNLYESGDGSLARNFEVWTVAPGNAIRHYWRDGASLEWALAETLANECAESPAVTGTTYDRNFEYVYSTTANRLHHRYFDQSTGKWGDGGVFGPTNADMRSHLHPKRLRRARQFRSGRAVVERNLAALVAQQRRGRGLGRDRDLRLRHQIQRADHGAIAGAESRPRSGLRHQCRSDAALLARRRQRPGVEGG